MSKIILFGFFILITFSVLSQQNATLYFRNGSKLEGIAQITKFSEVKFQKNKESKKVKYSYRELDKIVIWDKDRNKYIEYRYKVPVSETPKLLEIILEGYVSIYRKTHLNFGGTLGTILYMTFDDNKTLAHKLGYIDVPPYKLSLFKEYIPDFNTKNKSIKKKLIKKVKRCKDILNKLEKEKKEFRKKGILDLVIYYNNNCKR